MIDTFVRGLPNIYNTLKPDMKEAVVTLEIEDLTKAGWILKKNESWELFVGSSSEYTSKIVMNSDTAWRMFSKDSSNEESRKRTTVQGEAELGLLILDLTTLMK